MSDTADQIKEKLFVDGVEGGYPTAEKYHDHLLEQYKVFVESADRISARRHSTNSFFMTINTAIIAVVGYVHLGSTSSTDLYWLVALAGVTICYLWYRIILSYKGLNTAKYNVVHEIEKKLPLSPFDAEWEALGRGQNPSLYRPFTHIEIGIPWVFLILHSVAFIQSFPWEMLRVICATG